MQRVVVVGTTGAGKTTFGKALAKELESEFIELDALYWQANWTPAPDFANQVADAIKTERWVVDGNYNNEVQPFILADADTLTWLDYSFGTKLWRLLRRTCRHLLTREVLWGGNTAGFRKTFFSRESIILFFFQTHWKQRQRYEKLLPELPEHLTVYRLHRPAEAEGLLAAAKKS